ncbi:MAG TPA: hypothetical protein VFX16_38160 [Pseudonocardiaceae bacterium]|nr:hypothetical protein [Pseudonocardiaceae bacterium]
MIDQLIELSHTQPSDPERPIWVWLAAWSAAAGEMSEPLLALKIAAFTLSWRERCDSSRRTALVLHRLDTDSTEFHEIRTCAIAAAQELPGAAMFSDVDELTVPRLVTYLYGDDLSMSAEERMSTAIEDQRLAGLTADRRLLMERRCGSQWATFMEELLEPDEMVRAAAPVFSFEIRVSALVLTDRRIVVVFPPKFFVGNASFVEVHLTT